MMSSIYIDVERLIDCVLGVVSQRLLGVECPEDGLSLSRGGGVRRLPQSRPWRRVGHGLPGGSAARLGTCTTGCGDDRRRFGLHSCLGGRRRGPVRWSAVLQAMVPRPAASGGAVRRSRPWLTGPCGAGGVGALRNVGWALRSRPSSSRGCTHRKRSASALGSAAGLRDPIRWRRALVTAPRRPSSLRERTRVFAARTAYKVRTVPTPRPSRAVGLRMARVGKPILSP
ncbi:hypothetical protein PLESTF_001588100 [Pleodorina starrii]|nr:hypothetical protein PLESTF_001588100 [Pleodorina starrii]